MIEEEIEALLTFLQQIDEAAIPLEEVLQRTEALFIKLEGALQQLPFGKREEIIAKIVEISERFAAATKRFIDHTHLGEKELLEAGEKAQSFNEDEWRRVQEAKKRIVEHARRITFSLLGMPPLPKGPKAEDGKRPPPRSSWMKS